MCKNIKKKDIPVIESVNKGISFLSITYFIIFDSGQNYF